jgi:hypothetical protein
MGATKNELLGGTAPFAEPVTPKGKVKGKSKLEAEIERKNQGTKPKVVGQRPRGARADNAEHDHPSRHGARGDQDDDDDDDDEGEGERKPKRYLRKKQVARRYGDVHERTIPRMVADGRLPPPDLFNGRFPLWSEDLLDAHDRKATRALARREYPRCLVPAFSGAD